MPSKGTLHFRDQDDQPCGSSSRKCSVCGRMIWGDSLPEGDFFTEDQQLFTKKVANKHNVVLCDGK
jgi:hypothetical protein